MGRSLLNVPLDVLREQLGAVRIYLLHEGAVAAFCAVGLDATEYAAQAGQAVAAATEAIVALQLARDDRTFLARKRAAWKADYAGWVAQVRLNLEALGPSSAEVVAEVRRRLGHRPGRNFAPSRDNLERALATLRSKAAALQVATWHPDPFPPGERLLALADALVEQSETAERALRGRSAAATSTRQRLQQLLRAIRVKWQLVRSIHPSMPELALDSAAEHISRAPRRSRRAPEGEFVVSPGESGPSLGGLEASPSEFEAGTGESMTGPRELEASRSELEPGHRVLVAVQVVDGQPFARAGRPSAGDGRQFARDGHPFAGVEPPFTQDDPASTRDGS